MTRLGLVLGAFLLIAYFLLPHALKSYGEKVLSLDIEEINLSWGQLDLKNIKHHDQTISIPAVRLRFNIIDLIRGKITEVTINGGKAQPKIDPAQPIEIPNIISFLDDIPLSIGHLEINNLEAIIALPHIWEETIHLTGSIKGATGTAKGHQLSMTATLNPISHIKGGVVNVYVDKSGLKADMEIHEIRLKDIPSAFTIKAKATQTQGFFAFLTTFSGDVTNDNHETILKIHGISTTPASGQLTFHIPTLLIDNHKLPLRIFDRPLLNKINAYSLHLNGDGGLIWDQEGIKPSGKIHLKDATIGYETIKVNGLSFAIPLDQVLPSLKFKQNVHIDSIHSPIMDITNIMLAFVADDNALKLASASGNVWGGSASLNSFTLFPLPTEQSLMLTLDKVTLQPLITHLEISNMSAEGLLDGTIPMRIFGDHSIAIENGVLKSIEKGHISYKWDGALASSDPNLSLAAKALQNFTYDQATLNINKDRNKEPELVLDIKGKNPRLLEGRSFNFKINVTGKILSALESTIQTFQADLKDLKKRAK